MKFFYFFHIISLFVSKTIEIREEMPNFQVNPWAVKGFNKIEKCFFSRVNDNLL